MPDTGQGMSVGDAVLSFIGDTTRLDESIDSLPQKVEAGVSRASGSLNGLQSSFDATGEEAEQAGEEIQDSMDQSTVSIKKARGEAMLLGEAFGVRMPRELRSFISELPGVGTALESAFTATAALFLLDLIVKLTEKTSDFVGAAFVYTESMKTADAATASLNKTITDQEAALTEAKKKFDEVGMSAKQIALLNIKDNLGSQLDAINAKLDEENKKIQESGSGWKQYLLAASDYFLGTTHLIDAAIEKNEEQKNNETQAAKATAKAKQVADEQTAAVHKQALLDEQKAEDEFYAKNNAQLAAYAWEAQQKFLAIGHAWNQMMQEMTNVPVTGEKFSSLALSVGDVSDSFTKGKDAAHAFGITLKSDLIVQVEAMKKAFGDLNNSGLASYTQLADFTKQIDVLQKKIDSFDQDAVPKTNAFFQAFQKGGEQSSAAMWGFADAYGQGMSKVISGEEGIGQAMEAATKQFVDQIGERAMVQGMYCLAEAAMNFWDPGAASSYLVAAAEFFAVGGATLGIGSVMGGGSSSGAGGSGFQGTGRQNPNSPIQTTGGTTQTVSGGTHVQSFARGGLISAPTLAMLGDSPSGPEAVLPLGDEATMSRIADHIAARMSSEQSGGGHTFNMRGHFSKSEMKEIAKKLSRSVQFGTSMLHSSSTGRVVKRSP
jgi:hypothetical protein